MAQEPSSGIEITIGFFPHAFFLFPPIVVIDGRSRKLSWGTHFFPVGPGRHAITLGFMYFFMPIRFEKSTDVIVEKEKTVKVEYRARLWKPGAGSFRIR